MCKIYFVLMFFGALVFLCDIKSAPNFKIFLFGRISKTNAINQSKQCINLHSHFFGSLLSHIIYISLVAHNQPILANQITFSNIESLGECNHCHSMKTVSTGYHKQLSLKKQQPFTQHNHREKINKQSFLSLILLHVHRQDKSSLEIN